MVGNIDFPSQCSRNFLSVRGKIRPLVPNLDYPPRKEMRMKDTDETSSVEFTLFHCYIPAQVI
jgi:hypothetical protein